MKVIFRFSDSSWCGDAISSDSVDHLVTIVPIVSQGWDESSRHGDSAFWTFLPSSTDSFLVQAVPLPVAAAENRNNHVKPSRCMLKSSLCFAPSIRPWHYFLLVAIKVMCL